MYRYFISYNFNDNKGFGFANCELQRNEKINNIKDIQGILEKIKEKDNLKDVVILNYKLLNEEDELWKKLKLENM